MSEKVNFDLIVIGAGPGGYVTAIKAAQLGLKTACVESRSTLGGTCLNVGCIPSKALLNASEKYIETKDHLAKFGIKVTGVELDLDTMMAKKNQIVKELTQGIAYLFKKNKVTHIQGHGKILKAGVVEVQDIAGKVITYQTKNIVIATGSVSADLPGITIDEENIVSSTGALALKHVPNHLVVIGGGYIGLEMGSVWARLGSQVSVVEFQDSIVPMMDQDVQKALKKSLESQGLKMHLGAKVAGVAKTKDGCEVKLQDAKTGKDLKPLKADVVLVSIGRKPNTQNLGLEALGVEQDQRGFIKINNSCETNISGIYAIGDVTPGPMLAHKAEEEGVAVAEILAGQKGHVNYDVIPAVIYTMPEVASVGKTEQELKAEGVKYTVGTFPFAANSRAKANDLTEGFVKILADAKTDEILGAHIISADAGTLIAEFAVAMEYKATSEDIARICHAHPTTSEAIKEAALATHFKAIHS